MSTYKYEGNNGSVRVASILFAKGVDTELTDEQVKALKADRFGKAMLDDKSIIEIESEQDDSKPVSKMTVPELESYITENGGEFAESDNKPELLVIAQAIEDAKNDKG